MRFQCSHCNGIVEVEDSAAGQIVTCGLCGGVLAVPQDKTCEGVAIGDFIIKKLLGNGGMGAVYLAHQISLDREAALKILHDNYQHDEHYIEEFIAEARAAAKLNHPNIVQAYAVDEEDGTYFFAMEFAHGTTLKDVLKHSGRIVPDRALGIIEEVASGLDFAWNKANLIHRDIKPDNIILTTDGFTKLADMGLARVVTEPSVDHESEEIFGTPQYISPEQLLGANGNCQSDIYSLGATFYHIVTGEYPYNGTDIAEVVDKHITEMLTPVQELVPDIPDNIAMLIENMMAKRPKHRYGNYDQLLNDIQLVQAGEMPEHDLHPDAQLPISAENADMEPSPDAFKKSKRKSISHSSKSKSLKQKVLEEPKADLESATVQKVNQSYVAGVVIALLIVAVLLVVAYALVNIKKPVEIVEEEPQEVQIEQVEEQPEEITLDPVVEGLKAKLLEPQDVAAALQEYKDYKANNPDSEALAELTELAMNLDDKQIREKRHELHQQTMSEWEDKSEELIKEKEKQDEIRKQKELAEKEKQKLAELERQKEVERVARVKKDIAETRLQALELCRKNEYSDARFKFELLEAKDDKELVRWAKVWKKAIALAEKNFELVANSKEKLKGEKFLLRPNKFSRISYITRKSLELTYIKRELVDGKMVEVVDSVEQIALDDLPVAKMWELCKMSWEIDNGKGEMLSDLSYQFGVYMAVGGVQTYKARQMIESAGIQEGSAEILKELNEIEKIVFAEYIQKMEAYVKAGKVAEAKSLQANLKRYYSKLYSDNQTKVEGIIPE